MFNLSFKVNAWSVENKEIKFSTGAGAGLHGKNWQDTNGDPCDLTNWGFLYWSVRLCIHVVRFDLVSFAFASWKTLHNFFHIALFHGNKQRTAFFFLISPSSSFDDDWLLSVTDSQSYHPLYIKKSNNFFLIFEWLGFSQWNKITFHCIFFFSVFSSNWMFK